MVKKNCKYFIGHLYNYDKVKPLNIMLPKQRTYVKNYDGETKWMYPLTENDDLLEKHDTIWDKVSADVTKKIDREPLFKKQNIISCRRSYRFLQ